MSTPIRAASVEMRSVPDGVTCCHRMSCFILIVQATVERPVFEAVTRVEAEVGDIVWATAVPPLVVKASTSHTPTDSRGSERVDGMRMDLSLTSVELGSGPPRGGRCCARWARGAAQARL